MSLHPHKARPRLGPAEMVVLLLLSALGVLMLVGSLAVSSTAWQTVEGTILSIRRVQHATNALGTPHRFKITYAYNVGGRTHTDLWEGEWPESHSPNALPPEAWDQFLQPGYPLRVLYDPERPERNSIHASRNHYPVWWFRLSLGVCVLVVWSLFALYPRWKARL